MGLSVLAPDPTGWSLVKSRRVPDPTGWSLVKSRRVPDPRGV